VRCIEIAEQKKQGNKVGMIVYNTSVYNLPTYPFTLIYSYTRSKKLSLRSKNDLGMACHTPLLKKVKKQGEMPLPSLGPIPLKNVEFRDGMGPRLGNGISRCFFTFLRGLRHFLAALWRGLFRGLQQLLLQVEDILTRTLSTKGEGGSWHWQVHKGRKPGTMEGTETRLPIKIQNLVYTKLKLTHTHPDYMHHCLGLSLWL